MTPEQQLTLELTRVGVIGTLVGTFLGLSVGILTTLLNRKWQRDDEIRKVRRTIVDNRINAMEKHLSDLMEKISRVRDVTDVFINLPITEKTRYDEARNDYSECCNKFHVLASFGTLGDEEFNMNLLNFMNETLSFSKSLPNVETIQTNENKLIAEAEIQKWKEFDHKNLWLAYALLIKRIDDYRVEQLGTKRKKQKSVE